MTTVTLEKRVRVLEAEIKLLKSAVAHPRALASKSKKKLPRWLQASLKDVKEGRVYGPFNTVKELRASLESHDED